MAGHPPKIHEKADGGTLVLSYNECQSVPVASARRAFQALQGAELLTASTTFSYADGRITITIPRPGSVPADRRKRDYKQWAEQVRKIVHAMNICIQSERAPSETVRHIGRIGIIAS